MSEFIRILKQIFNFVKLFFHIIIYIIKLPLSILWFIAHMFYFLICKLIKNLPIILTVFTTHLLLTEISMLFLHMNDIETFVEFIFLPFKVLLTHPFQFIVYLFNSRMPLNIFGGINLPYLFLIPIISVAMYFGIKLILGFLMTLTGMNREMSRDGKQKFIPYMKKSFVDAFSSIDITFDIDAIRTNSRSHGRFYRL